MTYFDLVRQRIRDYFIPGLSAGISFTIVNYLINKQFGFEKSIPFIITFVLFGAFIQYRQQNKNINT